MGMQRKDDSRANLINNYFYINTNSQRSTSRNPPGSYDSERDIRETKSKGAIHISERTLDLEYIGEAYEASENNVGTNETPDNTSATNLIFKPNKDSQPPSVGNLGVESTRGSNTIQSLSINHINSHQNSRNTNPVTSSNSSGYNHAIPHSINSSTSNINIHQPINSPKAKNINSAYNLGNSFTVDQNLNTNISTSQPNKNKYSSTITGKLNTTTEVSSPSNKYSSHINIQSSTNNSTSLNTYQLSNTACNPSNYHNTSHNNQTNTSNTNTSQTNVQQSASHVGIYRYINPSSVQQRNMRSMYRSDSLYAQTSQADHYYAMGSTSTREKNAMGKPFSTTNTSNMQINSLTNTSGNLSGLGLKTPHSNRGHDKAVKKPTLLDKSNLYELNVI